MKFGPTALVVGGAVSGAGQAAQQGFMNMQSYVQQDALQQARDAMEQKRDALIFQHQEAMQAGTLKHAETMQKGLLEGTEKIHQSDREAHSADVGMEITSKEAMTALELENRIKVAEIQASKTLESKLDPGVKAAIDAQMEKLKGAQKQLELATPDKIKELNGEIDTITKEIYRLAKVGGAEPQPEPGINMGKYAPGGTAPAMNAKPATPEAAPKPRGEFTVPATPAPAQAPTVGPLDAAMGGAKEIAGQAGEMAGKVGQGISDLAGKAKEGFINQAMPFRGTSPPTALATPPKGTPPSMPVEAPSNAPDLMEKPKVEAAGGKDADMQAFIGRRFAFWKEKGLSNHRALDHVVEELRQMGLADKANKLSQQGEPSE